MALSKTTKEKIRKILSETSRRQKAQHANLGSCPYIKTLAIISAENPMGQQMDKEYNKASTKELIERLRIAHYGYFMTKGLYDSPENSVIIYNIPLDETLKLCYEFNQESVIFVDLNRENGELSYQYWEGDDHNSKLKMQREVHKVVDATNDSNYWTQISRDFKFRIPFFENINRINKMLMEKEERYNVKKLIEESFNPKRTGYSKYMLRGKLYGKK